MRRGEAVASGSTAPPAGETSTLEKHSTSIALWTEICVIVQPIMCTLVGLAQLNYMTNFLGSVQSHSGGERDLTLFRVASCPPSCALPY